VNVFSRLVMYFPDITTTLNCTHANHHLAQAASPQSPSKGTHSGIDRVQATRRPVSSWVGDHQRIPAVVCRSSPCFFDSLGLAPSPLSLHPLQPCSPEAQLNSLNLNTAHPVTPLNPWLADVSSFRGTSYSRV
jgi:hypothetical protein